MAGLDAARNILNALSVQAHEATAKCITGTVSVHNLLFIDLDHGVNRNGVTDSSHGLIRTLSDNDGAWAAVSLGQVGELFRNFFDIVRTPTSSLGIRASFVLIAKQ